MVLQSGWQHTSGFGYTGGAAILESVTASDNNSAASASDGELLEITYDGDTSGASVHIDATVAPTSAAYSFTKYVLKDNDGTVVASGSLSQAGIDLPLTNGVYRLYAGVDTNGDNLLALPEADRHIDFRVKKRMWGLSANALNNIHVGQSVVVEIRVWDLVDNKEIEVVSGAAIAESFDQRVVTVTWNNANNDNHTDARGILQMIVTGKAPGANLGANGNVDLSDGITSQTVTCQVIQ